MYHPCSCALGVGPSCVGITGKVGTEPSELPGHRARWGGLRKVESIEKKIKATAGPTEAMEPIIGAPRGGKRAYGLGGDR